MTKGTTHRKTTFSMRMYNNRDQVAHVMVTLTSFNLDYLGNAMTGPHHSATSPYQVSYGQPRQFDISMFLTMSQGNSLPPQSCSSQALSTTLGDFGRRSINSIHARKSSGSFKKCTHLEPPTGQCRKPLVAKVAEIAGIGACKTTT
jgi:hypothetical protein